MKVIERGKMNTHIIMQINNNNNIESLISMQFH